MQAASAVQVTVRHFGVWNLMLCLVGAITLWVAAAWQGAVPDETSRGAAALLITLAGGATVVALTLWRRHSITLRWDTQRWFLTSCRPDVDAVALTELCVVLDLGGWMLLKTRAEGCARCDWIPLQRSGLERQWQLLRCALYAQGGRWVQPALGHEGMRSGLHA